MTSSPMPMLLCGKIPTHIQAAKDIVKPEIEVVKHSATTEDAVSFLQAAMANQPYENTSYPKPLIITMGGGFTADDQEQVEKSVDGLKDQVVFFRPQHMKPGSSGPPAGGPPPAEVVMARLRKVLDENMKALKDGSAKGQVFYY